VAKITILLQGPLKLHMYVYVKNSNKMFKLNFSLKF